MKRASERAYRSNKRAVKIRVLAVKESARLADEGVDF
jgi:hypothetical protein